MAKAAKRFVICVDNSGYEVSLERRKIYRSIPDAKAESLGQVRVIDESGEDYLIGGLGKMTSIDGAEAARR